MFEGFLTYGGMSVREMEAMTVGFDESMEMDVISQGPQFIKYCVDQLDAYGVPVITPGGGLGAHLDCLQFIPHVPQEQYAACALSCALYICGGIRGGRSESCDVQAHVSCRGYAGTLPSARLHRRESRWHRGKQDFSSLVYVHRPGIFLRVNEPYSANSEAV